MAYWKCTHTQLESEASRDKLQTGAADRLRPQVGTDLDSAAKSKGMQDEEGNEMWVSAYTRASLDGGTAEDIQCRAVRIYRGMKKKLKVKQKKKVTNVVTVA